MLVADTSVISVFSEMGRFDLLLKIVGSRRLAVPGQVVSEVVYGYERKCRFYEDALKTLKQAEDAGGHSKADIEIVEVAQDTAEKFSASNRLGIGESSVIVFCKQGPKERIALLDDRKAREVAKKSGVLFTGTIGLIKRGYEICRIKDKKELRATLDLLDGTGFRCEGWLADYVLSSEKDR